MNVNGQSLSRVSSHRYLGIEVDKTLNWQPQTDTMVKKVSAGLGALKKVRDYAPHQALIRMYEALILPYFDYCSEVWGCLGKCLSSRLQKLQNRTARIITYLGYEQRSIYILNDLGWETLGQRPKKQLAVCAYKSIHNLFPVGLKSLFEPVPQVHAYNLRGSSNNIFDRRPETDAARNSFCYRGALLWNGLPNETKTQPSVASFKNSLRLLHF